MNSFAIILIAIVLFVIAFFSIKENIKHKKEIKELEASKKRKYENEKKKSELKEKLQTGDNSTSFDTSINILQELSNKRK